MTLALLVATILVVSVLLSQLLTRSSQASGARLAAPPATLSTRTVQPAAAQAEPGVAARQFREQLDLALRQGLPSLGATPLVRLEGEARQRPWPLDLQERRKGRSQRIWRIDGDCSLPADLDFAAEVASQGDLNTRPGSRYQALMSGRRLRLANASVLQAWAHGETVQIDPSAELQGPVSAEAAIHLGRGIKFSDLQAPVIRSMGDPGLPGCEHAGQHQPLGEDEGVVWDAAARCGYAWTTTQIAPLRSWEGDLVGRQDITLGEGCQVFGHIRCQGDLTLRAGCHVSGDLTVSGELFLAPGCHISGQIQCESLMTLGAGCVIGRPETPAVATAAQVQMAEGVVVHGVLWSGNQRMDIHPAWRQNQLDAAHRVGQPSPVAQLVLALQAPAGPGRQIKDDQSSPWVQGLLAKTWQVNRTRELHAPHRTRIDARHAWEAALVCDDELRIGEGCRGIGNLVASGALYIEGGTLLLGSVSCGGELRMAGGSQISGSVSSKSAVYVGPGCVIGSVEHPVTVSAPKVVLAQGSIVHGRIMCAAGGGATAGPAVASSRLSGPAGAQSNDQQKVRPLAA